MTILEGKVVAVTGAGSGIGRALSQALVARGAHVALSDVDEEGLAETVASLAGATNVRRLRSPIRSTSTSRRMEATTRYRGGEAQ